MIITDYVRQIEFDGATVNDKNTLDRVKIYNSRGKQFLPIS